MKRYKKPKELVDRAKALDVLHEAMQKTFLQGLNVTGEDDGIGLEVVAEATTGQHLPGSKLVVAAYLIGRVSLPQTIAHLSEAWTTMRVYRCVKELELGSQKHSA